MAWTVYSILSAVAPVGAEIPEGDIPVFGTKVPLAGDIVPMLEDVFAKSERECRIPICFRPDDQGRQQNPVRDIVVQLLRRPTVSQSEGIARRLARCTTHRSKPGLLFLIAARDGRRRKLLISRFPAEQGVTTQTSRRHLDLRYVRQVFLRSANAYKAAYYEGQSFDADFWRGFAIDKQISPNSPSRRELSDYWIKAFLMSDFEITKARGSEMASKAFRVALSSPAGLPLKDELIAAATLIRNLDGQRLSVSDICGRLQLSDNATNLVVNQMPRREVADAPFEFDYEVFSRGLSIKVIYLDSGAALSAPTQQFDELWDREARDGGRVSFTTTGIVVDEKAKRKVW